MGVRLAAVVFDRSEALVISAALDAAGIANWIYWYNTNCNSPAQILVYDGFQVVVAEQSLEEAAAVLDEARANPCADTEVLAVRGNVFDRIAGFVFGFLLLGGAPMPLRETSWQPAPQDGHTAP
jgi:hypothetical protein